MQCILRRAAAANETDFRVQVNYNCTVTERHRDGPVMTYEHVMVHGSPHRRLIAVDGRPIADTDQKREDHRFRNEIMRREHESARDRTDRITKYHQQREQTHVMLSQILQAFEFSFMGTETLRGHTAYVLNATARPGYHPPDNRARVLTGMRGRVWIEDRGYHWLKVEAEVIKPVDFYGVLGHVKPGTRFDLEQIPVGPDVWQPSLFRMTLDATIIGIFRYRLAEEATYTDYRPADPDAASVPGKELSAAAPDALALAPASSSKLRNGSCPRLVGIERRHRPGQSSGLGTEVFLEHNSILVDDERLDARD